MKVTAEITRGKASMYTQYILYYNKLHTYVMVCVLGHLQHTYINDFNINLDKALSCLIGMQYIHTYTKATQ